MYNAERISSGKSTKLQAISVHFHTTPAMKTRRHEVAGVGVLRENGIILMEPESNFSRVELEIENPHHCEMPTTIAQRYHEFMADSCCSQLCDGPNPHMARNVYGFIFLLTNLLAWMVRDYGHNALAKLKRKWRWAVV